VAEVFEARANVFGDSTFGVSLTTDKVLYTTGEPITIEFGIFNRTGEEATLHFRDAQRYDFTIEEDEEKEVWRWSNGKMFAEVLGEETLGPGREEVVYTETYAGRLEPGDYQLTGMLVALDRPLSASVTITID